MSDDDKTSKTQEELKALITEKKEVSLMIGVFVQSGASYLSQGFVMFFHVSCEGLPGQ